MADSRIQKNSSDHSADTYAEQQLAIQDSERAQQLAEARAAEAAVQAAKRKAPVKNMTPTLDANDFGIPFTITDAPAQPKGRSTRKGK